jgi:MoaA/NifB/PqqE/SkfB family radical SAM enzyme
VQVSREKYQKNNISDMSTEESLKAIRNAIENNATKIVLSGGEPTLRTDIVKLVKYILDHGVQVQIQTNGIKTDSIENILSCAETNKSFLEFMIPLHGNNSESHGKVNNYKGSFIATLKSLSIIARNNVSIVGKIVCTKYGGKNIPEIVRLFQEYKTKLIIVAYPHCVQFPDNLILETDIEKEDMVKLFQVFDRMVLDIPIYLQGFPRCFTGELKNTNIFFQEEMSDFLNTEIVENKQRDWIGIPWHEYRRMEKKKFSHCGICGYDQKCEGIWKEYMSVYGER